MEIMQNAITVHIYSLYVFLLIMMFNLYSVINRTSFISLAKRLKFMTPIYHLSNAVVIYTGTIVSFYSHMFSFKIAIMIPASIFLLVIEIKRYKKQRVILTSNVEAQEEFYKYAKKIYIIEIFVLISVFMLSRVL
ncbi:hypothetical protein [Arcobacter porcinus]|uniref:Putative membrane protein n=1 Tax=Arcobacter porcinus TaxID=1935204 RepID=A0A1C0B0V7_9BACT|nr:hypothetical protein [Arcobacter porcinus]OCL87443.1 hypothetical protein AAX27_02056 [Aliarcobacter thereius]OCL81710.1 hypothetical protein AAW30_01803 [Arcobacter porcinus]OCL84498.1 hypothetical protein AAW29_00171 [Arcobacter porcinus]OCL89039.1 hypothetical protein AAX30_00171 [Arcobacter porcinus]OCL93519.1 hypothetical protein AAX28_01062 [Arcobacter porcinus]